MPTDIVHPLTGRPIKLGRTQARRTAKSMLRASAMHNFLAVLPDDIAPTVFDNTSGIQSWGMMLNNALGDCTIAGPGHMIQAWTAAAGSEVTVDDATILDCYSKFDGYVVGDPNTDQGGDILTVCQDWQSQGIGGHKIDAHAEVNMTQMRWQQAIYVFGALNTGVWLPISAQAQTGGTWDIVGDGLTGDSAKGSWGGHCVAVVGYDLEGVTCVTWGELQRITWRFVMWYFDEAIACLSGDWTKCPIATDGLADVLQEIGH